MPGARPIVTGLFTDDGGEPRLLAARCGSCSKPHFPAGPVCPYCGAGGCVELRVGPEGRLGLYTAVLSRPPGYRGDVPSGLRVVARLTEPRLDRLRPGLAMRLVVEPVFTGDEGQPVLSYAFAPEEA